MSNSGDASRRAVADAAIASAARVVILAVLLGVAAMLFAPRAHASPVAGGAIAMTGEAGQLPQSMAGAVEAQTGSPQASVGTIAGAVADVAERISSAGG